MFDDYGTNYPIQPKQFQALVTIANTDGEPMTLDEVLAKLQSSHFSSRFARSSSAVWLKS